jgi:hypothetical protein
LLALSLLTSYHSTPESLDDEAWLLKKIFNKITVLAEWPLSDSVVSLHTRRT